MKSGEMKKETRKHIRKGNFVIPSLTLWKLQENCEVSNMGESYYSQNTAMDFEMQRSKGASMYSTSSSIGTTGENPCSTHILTESVNVPETDFKMMEILSGLGDEQWSKRLRSELQNLVDKLREDFANDLEERDTVILLYKNLWRESEAALASIKCEMKHIKAELEALKQRQLDKDAHDLSIGECETSENQGRANCFCSLKLSSSPNESNMDQAAVRVSHVKDAEGPDTKTNLNSLINVMPQAHAQGTTWERAALLFSWDKSLGEGDTSENWGRMNSKNTLEANLNLKENMMDEGAMLLSQGRNLEDLDSKTNLNSSVNMAPQVLAEGTILERAAILFSRDRSLGEGETSENRCCKNSLEFNLNPNTNITDKGAMLLSLGKDDKDNDTKSNLNSPVIITPQAHAKETFWEQAAMVSPDRSLVDGEISENSGRENCKTILEDNLKPKGNIIGEETMLLSQGNDSEDLNTNTNLSSPGNVIPQTYAEGTFLERAAILFLRDRNLGEGETSENRGREKCKHLQDVNLNPKEKKMDEGLMLLSQGKDHKDLYTKANWNSPVNVALQSNTRETYLERAAILFSRDRRLGEGEISGNWGRENGKTSLEINLNPKQNIMGEGAMLPFQGKDHMDLDTKTNLSSPMNVTPQTHAEVTVLERAAILFSRDRSLGEEDETLENRGGASCKNSQGVNLNPLEETWDISKSAYDTEEFSNSYSSLKMPSTFRMEQFLDLASETDWSSEEDELIGTLRLKGQLESSSSVLSDDLVCSQSRCFYHGVQLEESNFDSDLTKLIDTSTSENSGKKRKCDNAIMVEDLSQILFGNSFTIKKLDPEEGNVAIGINSQCCDNPPEGSADVEYLSEKELGFISHCQHESDCIVVANEGECSSTKSESSWEHIEME